MKPRKSTGTTRVEVAEKGSFGWLMRIRRGDQFYQEFFSDSLHGGKRGAQRAARERYQALAAELPPPGSSEGKLSSRNSTGHVGVRLARSADPRGGGHVYDSYVAFWRDNGRDVTMRFACTKYGVRKALGLAVLARETRNPNRDEVVAEYAERAKQRSAARRKDKADKPPATKFPRATKPKASRKRTAEAGAQA